MFFSFGETVKIAFSETISALLKALFKLGENYSDPITN
jgi:hypothetical protein